MGRLLMFISFYFFSLSTWSSSVTRTDPIEFQSIFERWTQAFNQQKLQPACNLFSKQLIADYQGTPRKTYQTICNGFRKIFSDHSKTFHYRFKIREVYRDHDLAAVRITWYLTIFEKNKIISKLTDEGLDIFQQDSTGQWKIVNYLGYPTSSKSN